MINISNALYLQDVQELGDRPIIGYNSIVTLSSISAVYETDARPIENIWNPDTSSLWEADVVPTGNEIEIKIANTGAANVNYLGIAKHNFGTTSVEYVLQESDDDVTYTDVTTARTPSDNAAIIDYFDTTTAPYFKLLMTCSGSIPPYIGHIKLGEALILQRPMYVGHEPETLARPAKSITMASDTGDYLGKVITRRWQNGAVNQQNTDPSWVRTYLVPFIQHTQLDLSNTAIAQGPFFFAWRPFDWPLEVIYGWTNDIIRPKNQLANGLMEYSFNITGIA